MQNTDFIQTRFLRSRNYKLVRDGVEVVEKSILSSRSYHVPYECISPKSQQITSSNRKLFTACLIFTVITLVCLPVVIIGRHADGGSTILFWGLIAAFCWIAFFFSRVSVMVYAQNDGILLLYSDLPSQPEVAAFVRKLFEARNTFLRSKYGRLSLDQPIAQRLARLEMLRDQEVISDLEFIRLCKLQNEDRIEPLGPIGFSPK